MERSLSLVLDEMGKISLTLETMEAKKLDEFIIKNFNSSDEIRKKYKYKIQPFLEQYKDFITRVETDNNKKYNGSIVITELQNDLSIKKKKVLYKKQLIIFKEITKNKKFITALQNRDYINAINAEKNNEKYKRIFSDYYGIEIKFKCDSEDKFRRVMGQWRNSIKELHRYYDLIRTVLKEYKNRYKELELDSPAVIYSSYLAGQKVRYETELELEKQSDYRFEQAIRESFKNKAENVDDVKEPNRYINYADEEGYPGDLEHLNKSHISAQTIGEESFVSENRNYDLEYLNNVEDTIHNSEEPIRYQSGADEEGYPGDLERLDNSQYKVGDSDMFINKTKNFNNGHHRLFKFDN